MNNNENNKKPNSKKAGNNAGNNESEDIMSHSNGRGPTEIHRVSQKEVNMKEKRTVTTTEARSKDMYTAGVMEAHRKRSRKKGRKNAWLFRGVWLSFLGLLVLATTMFCIACFNDMLAINKPAETVTIKLEKDATIDDVASTLKANGIINNEWAYKFYSNMTKEAGNYQYGSFDMRKDMDYSAINNALRTSSVKYNNVRITFVEGTAITKMGEILEDEGICSKEDFYKAANNRDAFKDRFEIVKEIPENAESERLYIFEGYLFPDTYDFYKGESAEDVVETMLINTTNKLNKKVMNQMEKKGYTIDQTLTLASMVQKEAADKTDMFNVASVFENRLNDQSGLYTFLNSDPTAFYPYLKEEDVPENYDTAYNTYTHAGLPIGPITNPGESAISAVLEPNKTSYLYFCHAEDGTPYYATNEWEHNNNLYQAGLIE